MRHSITATMDLLVASRGANEAYPELHKVCAYLQWTRDYARFLETSRDYIKTKKAEINAKVLRAREEFREQNAMLRETVLWDWCPLWRILSDRKEIFDRLPSLPWKHDSEYPFLFLNYATIVVRCIPSKYLNICEPYLQIMSHGWCGGGYFSNARRAGNQPP